ncbi:hypothetical protein FHX74_000234 [Friedmanniella endophytica]|uniref:Uncharacterized protein n=1 Tax=Microlunatus kandeliicorticis TaxID=1759536 RepID=A0A7W3IP35_9ACTN|nr:hypothetical protein [Microlunatus kandeliicorticis]MBA8792640.1 hypothetical protein [Microlunatus kandeliicorticis]
MTHLHTARRRLTGVLAAAALLGSSLAVAGATVTAPTAAAAGTGQLSITNPDVLPGNDAIVFNKIQTPADSYQRFHNQVAITLKNTGSAPLTVSSATATTDFAITSPWKLPFTLSTGASVSFTVAFTATGGAWHDGTASIGWSNGSTQTSTLRLTGWWQKYSEHNLEPTFPDLIHHFGYTTVTPTSMYSRGAYQAFSSDEVLVPYWKQRDPSQPARITQLGAWRGYPSTLTVSKYAKGSPNTLYKIFAGLPQDAQSALPRNSAWGRGTATFTLSGTAGLKLDSEYTDPTLNNSAIDRSSGCTAAQCGQHVRAFVARDADGNVIPGSYLFTEDLNGINYDYNDNMFLIENITPAS